MSVRRQLRGKPSLGRTSTYSKICGTVCRLNAGGGRNADTGKSSFGGGMANLRIPATACASFRSISPRFGQRLVGSD